MQAIRDAQTAVDAKEMALNKQNDLVNFFQEDYDNIWKARDAALAEILAAEVADAKERLRGLEEKFVEDKKLWDAYLEEEERLK
jgi:hypothetical protein